MSQQYTTLVGAESVERAAYVIRDASEGMRAAASQIEDSLQRHRTYLDEWLIRFEQALKEKE